MRAPSRKWRVAITVKSGRIYSFIWSRAEALSDYQRIVCELSDGKKFISVDGKDFAFAVVAAEIEAVNFKAVEGPA